MTILLNRNYVQPKLNELLNETGKILSGTNIEIHYLDANFPFINKFPLLPHLSHNDGKKIDISLIYETKAGEITNKQKSVSGYGLFENPKPNEYNQIEKCLNKGYFQYDFPKYLTFGKINEKIVLVSTFSMHRKDSLSATEYIMDYLKKDAPFWKNEFYEKKSSWV